MGSEVRRAPRVSVVMPCYNSAAFIEEAIRSVMAQTVMDWELIVLDDGSRDGTCEIVEKLAAGDSRIRLVRSIENMGVARARNRGFDLCSGSYVALLDSDDIWHPEKLEVQLARMEQTGAGLSCTAYAIVGADGQKVRNDVKVPEQITFEELLKVNRIGCSTVMLAVEILKEHRFNTSFYHEDYVLWLQLLRAGVKAVGCPQVLVDWRYIANSRSFDKRKAAKNRWKIYREYLGLPVGKSLWLFAGYGAAGLKKYLSFHRSGENHD